ncbi:DeoR/GlpR family DNA-binding transcription regulator [Paenibacillus popilliae]|nr:DeoR/GlpR family DNA-binding transcription regulator [Paenibacillus sp. SDF0028]
MLAIERRKRIMQHLFQDGRVLVAELSKQFRVTEETVRRDLDRMEKEGLLLRTHGGAFLAETSVSSDVPVWVREDCYLSEKKWIGTKCARLIQHGDTIMLDSSTTSLHIAKIIKARKQLTVITNSLNVIMELSDAEHIKLICTGGTLRHRSLSYSGHAAANALARYTADKAFLSCSGIDLTHGVTDANEEEAEIRKIMLHHAKQSILVADITKCEKIGLVKIAELSSFHTLVTNCPLPLQWREGLAAQSIILDDQCDPNKQYAATARCSMNS